jgi:hypothetical protein
VSLLGRRNHVFTWEAIAGTSPHTFGLGIGALEQAQDIGPVRLTPGGICMREQVFSEGSRGRQPCTSHGPPVRTLCTSDVSASRRLAGRLGSIPIPRAPG